MADIAASQAGVPPGSNQTLIASIFNNMIKSKQLGLEANAMQ